MDQRVRFIAEYLKGYFPFNELCLQFSNSRKTGYKWVERYEQGGSQGLADRSRRPQTCPHAINDAIIQAIVHVRMKHPTWGPKKLLRILAPRYPDLPAQQRRFDIFCKEYNTERPHEALSLKTPSSVYIPSLRRMPKRLGHYDYPYHFEVRRVSRNSGIRWRARWVQVSSTLAEEYIGFEEIDDGIHNVYFCELLMGRFVEQTMKI